MKYLLPLLFLFALACKKDECTCPEPPAVEDCEANHYAFYTVSNGDSNDAYDLFVNGSFWTTIPAGGIIQDAHLIEADSYVIDAYEVDWTLTQAHYQDQGNVIACHHYGWVFP